MEEILKVLLEQMPVVIVLGLGIYQQLREKKNLIKDSKSERTKHQKELKELNEHIRDTEKENFQTLQDLVVIIENIEKELKKIPPNEKGN